MKRALITGITGQDGWYLSRLLLAKGYEVHGMTRRSNEGLQTVVQTLDDVVTLPNHVTLHTGDLAEKASLLQIMSRVQPDEVYNLGGQSQVRVSFEQPEYTADVVATGTLRLLEAIRECRKSSSVPTKYFQAGSSEMFGTAPSPQNEATPFRPRSPYAVAKCAAHWYTVSYREAYGLFTCNGILFNHESPQRGENFVTRKITRAVGRIKVGSQNRLVLGNIDARRDWGFAGDYVEAMWRMLQQNEPDDYVLASGHSYTVKEFLQAAFATVDLDWEQFVDIDARYLRPNDANDVRGDASKAREQMGWTAQTGFHDIVKMMVACDLQLAATERE